MPQGGTGHRPHDGGPAVAAQVLDELIERFGHDQLAVELWDHGNPVDATRNDSLALLATERGWSRWRPTTSTTPPVPVPAGHRPGCGTGPADAR